MGSENVYKRQVVKGIKIKITAKFRASRRLRFEDTKIIMSPEMRPKSFGIFEKRAPGDRKRGYCLDLSLHITTERSMYGGAIINCHGSRE